MSNSLTNTSIEKFKDTIAKKHGLIIAVSPDGEVFECRSLREATEKTGIPKSTVAYVLKNRGQTKGWRFERCPT